MKEHDVKLTLQETEQLCRLYMDCRLTVLEETELQYVLGKMPYSSPCIDEVRMLMGVSIPMKAKESSKKRFAWFNRKTAIGIAASVTILLAVGVTLFNSPLANDKDSSGVYIAYANGQKISQELSVQQVKSDMDQADEFLKHIAKLEAQEQEQVENFINQIEQ